jgi:hypothetical protein
MTSYLIFDSLALAQARSAQQDEALGCEPGTTFWWVQIEHPTTHQGALQIDAGGPYGSDGLTPTEIASLVAEAEMGPAWFPAAP